MALARTPKKTGTIEVRIADELKVAFVDQCRRDKVTVSETVRHLIEERLAPAPIRQPARPARVRMLAAGLLGAALGLGVAAPSFAHAIATDRSTFERLDRNHDGVLTFGEFAH